MAVTYEWVIERIDVVPEVDNKQEVVSSIHWRLNGWEENDSGLVDQNGEPVVYRGTVYGSVGIQYEPDATFIPYQQLTKDTVVSWVKNALGADEVSSNEQIVSAVISTQKTPKTVSAPFPWS